jgi:hypothetical protein
MKRRRVRHTTVIAAGAAGLAWGLVHHLGRTWGSTREERARLLPGDDIVAGAQLVTNHAITIRAPASGVWPWLVQMGWHRGGWYTSRWVDRLLFPANRPSADSILPEWQGLRVGDRIPDGPPEAGCFFRVELTEPGKILVLHSWTHLPAGMRTDPRYRLDWTWSFHLDQVGEEQTRFLFRSRATLDPAWARLGYQLLVVPADFIMGRSMCMGIRDRAEQRRGAHRPGPIAPCRPAEVTHVCDVSCGKESEDERVGDGGVQVRSHR